MKIKINMKNQILLSISVLLLLFSCQNATNKINETATNDKNTVETTTENPINAQIIDNSGGASFKFTNTGGTVWDFGTIQQGESPKFTFKFINNGNEPMIISNAKGSCGCTVPQWPKEPIAPGAEGEISVQFNSKGKKGSQNKTVTLTANTTPPTTKLRVTGQIEVTE
ncbi:MAG: hypothetical protein CMP49_05760 [Flavobacteriales bacterium]|jgi:hypothetical protein|nr:hypothetical protein [Flavobacteriales bacterium]|tara:strand:+ start:1446 stop:1949 length:504 start_codon:yes stop_codon:yes gene_type:complete